MGSGAGWAIARTGAVTDSAPSATPLPLPVTSSVPTSPPTEDPAELPDETSSYDGPATPSEETEAARVADAAAYREADTISDIPLQAITAYQRAEAVMGAAAPDCGVEWTMLAAVGRVLTDHGTRGGDHEIDDDGRATPAVVGKPLRDADGKRLADTDGGDLDGDDRRDRAVGPMLVPPATWQVVGLDGDADGEREPQDLDDAALATAVLLCAEDDDLGQTQGLRAALLRLHDDPEFVRSVLRVAADYEKDVAEGGEVPSGDPLTVVPVGVTPAPEQAPPARTTPAGDEPGDRQPGENPGQNAGQQGDGKQGGGKKQGGKKPEHGAESEKGGGKNGGGKNGGGSGGKDEGGSGKTDEPTDKPTDPDDGDPTETEAPDETETPSPEECEPDAEGSDADEHSDADEESGANEESDPCDEDEDEDPPTAPPTAQATQSTEPSRP